jgi:uncharacterized lipoprotein YddW (UPF0748 family)
LLEIIERLHNARFNTIYFQARGRADAMYNSAYEPWSPQLAGILGKDPGWDPLAFVIQEGHARGMEVHAWFNAFLVRTAPKIIESQPRHVTLAHPDWVQQVDGEWWSNPGLPGVRRYTVAVAMDIVRGYEIDGIHFDFTRYPARGMDDESTYEFFGRGVPKAQWRRDNVSAFIRDVRDSIRLVKPAMKIGAAPIGVFNGGVFRNALHSFEDVYQDSRRWLSEGWVDYLVPQLYWPISTGASDPDFASVARDWAIHSAGRQIVAGIGIYKNEVADQLPRLIDSARSVGLSGQAFFRYQFLEPFLDAGGKYATPSLVPPMPWLDSVAPPPPTHFAVANIHDGVFQLEWTPPDTAGPADPPARYAVYRSLKHPVDIAEPAHCIDLVPGNVTSYVDSIVLPKSPVYYYTVTSIDAAGNESSSFVEEGVTIPEIVRLSKRFENRTTLGSPFCDVRNNDLVVPFDLESDAGVLLTLEETTGTRVVTITDRTFTRGRHIVSFTLSAQSKGEYIIRLRTSNATLTRSLRISG